MTPFTDIYSLALELIKDYRLDSLAKKDYDSFLIQMEGILIQAIPRFTGSLTPLDYDLTKIPPSFNNTLTLLEQSILADYMVLIWFMKDTNDITQVNLKLQGRDKKTHASEANLKGKAKYLNDLKEMNSLRINEYQLSGDNFNKIFGL